VLSARRRRRLSRSAAVPPAARPIFLLMPRAERHARRRGAHYRRCCSPSTRPNRQKGERNMVSGDGDTKPKRCHVLIEGLSPGASQTQKAYIYSIRRSRWGQMNACQHRGGRQELAVAINIFRHGVIQPWGRRRVASSHKPVPQPVTSMSKPNRSARVQYCQRRGAAANNGKRPQQERDVTPRVAYLLMPMRAHQASSRAALCPAAATR